MDLENLKLILGIDDDSQDTLLTVLKEWVQKRIMSKIGAVTFPTVLDWVADEVTIKRFNRLSAEGLLSEGISGIAHKFEDNPLAEFKEVLENYVASQNGSTPTGSSRMVMM